MGLAPIELPLNGSAGVRFWWFYGGHGGHFNFLSRQAFDALNGIMANWNDEERGIRPNVASWLVQVLEDVVWDQPYRVTLSLASLRDTIA